MREQPQNAACPRCELLDTVMHPESLLGFLANTDAESRAALIPARYPLRGGPADTLTREGLPTWWTGSHRDCVRLWTAFAENVAHIGDGGGAAAVVLWPLVLWS
jgi:hypothetical protein